MARTISQVLGQRLAKSPLLKSHLSDLQELAGVEAHYLNANGQLMQRFPRQPKSPLHALCKLTPGLRARHTKSRQSVLSGENADSALPWTECHHRMSIEGETLGYLILSAWRTDVQTLGEARSLWLQFVRDGIDIRWTDFHQQWQRLPIISKTAIEAWKRLLKTMANEAILGLESMPKPASPSHQLPPLIRKASSVIQTQYHQPLTLEKVAAQCAISPEHLSRLFRQTTGLLFRDYLAETRIHAVCHELRTSSDSISQIALRNGFATLSRFNRTFLSIIAMTPSAWRKIAVTKPTPP